MPSFIKPHLPRNNDSVTVQPGHMWISDHSCASDKTGKKTHMCWPQLSDMSWLEDVKGFEERGETPRTVRYKVGKSIWYFKLACYHGDEGWWYDFDLDRSIQRVRHYRLFIPRTLQDHPDYCAPSDKKSK